MLVKTNGASILGIDATIVNVEVNITTGINYFIVGLADSAIKEAQQRIISSYLNLGYKFPGKAITVNLSPADLRKEGSGYDLPIALLILVASGQVSTEFPLDETLIMGELSLDGRILPLRGALSLAFCCRDSGLKNIILPKENALQAAFVPDINVYGVSTLTELIEFLSGETLIEPYQRPNIEAKLSERHIYKDDFSDVMGQESVKRALEIAAAGNHNIIMFGPPGAGKSMLAKRINTIIPPLTVEEALEVTKIHSIHQNTNTISEVVSTRPLRSPHHSISEIALVGGGGVAMPGEISLAHNGVLFLDELPEFKRSTLEQLRQPLEDKTISISRVKYKVDFPADFMLVASMNPCPCGYYNHPTKECRCSSSSIARYLSKISGPLLDRIDMHVEITPVNLEKMSRRDIPESSEKVRERVITARNIQLERYKDTPIKNNSMIGSKEIAKYCILSDASITILRLATERLGLSARAYDKIVKIARTIADLEGKEEIDASHIAEAIRFRTLDKQGWGKTY